MPFDGHKDDYEGALVFHDFYQATIQGLFTYYDIDKRGKRGIFKWCKIWPREGDPQALTFDKLFDCPLSMKKGKNVGMPKCVRPYHEIVWVKVWRPQKERNAKDDFRWQSGDWIGMTKYVRKRWRNSDCQWYVRCEQPLLKNGKELKQRKGMPVKILLTLVTHSTFNTSFDYTNRSKV